jgi:hypothetical protein
LDQVRDKAYNESLGDTGMRTVRGITRGIGQAIDPRNWLETAKTANRYGQAIFNPEMAQEVASEFADTLKGAPRRIGQTASALAQGDPDVGGEMIGNLLVGGAAGRAGQIGGAVKRGLSTTADLGWAATKGAAGNAPIVGPMGRGAIKGVRDRLARKAEISGGRLAPKNTQSIRAFSDDIERALAENPDLDMSAEPMTRGGSTSGRSSRRSGAMLEPERIGTASGEMVATRPDSKWGTTSVHSADDLEAALRSPQGQLRSSDVASPYMMRKRGINIAPEESVSSGIPPAPDPVPSGIVSETPPPLWNDISPDMPVPQRPLTMVDDAVSRSIRTNGGQSELLKELLRSEGQFTPMAGESLMAFQKRTSLPFSEAERILKNFTIQRPQYGP